MNHRNLPVKNLRKLYRVKDAAANINGYRHAIFLSGTGRYKGMWQNNLREGLGTFTTNNDLTYEGNWVNDRKHGYGLLKKQCSQRVRVQYEPIYDGEWNNNKRSGEGTSYYKNGSYEGQYKNNCRDGLGIMSFSDGSFYIGEWKSNLYHGIGAHYDANAGTFYGGYFVNGKRCGEGTLNFLNKRKIQKGFWKDGLCVASIIHDDIASDSAIPFEGRIPKIGLSDPMGVLYDSLKNENQSNDKPIKLKMKKLNVNFD